MSGNKLLGGCAKGPQWTYDEAGNICVSIPNCVTGEDLKIPPTPEIPEDLFTTCEISADGRSVSLTIPGKATPVVLKLNAIDGAVTIDSEGVATPLQVVDCVLQIPEAAPICWGLNAQGCPVIGIPNCLTGEELVIGSVQSIAGNVVDNTDPKNPIITAVASVSGEGVDNTDPQNPVINVPEVPEDVLTVLSQAADTGTITYTDERGNSVTAETKHSTTVPTPEGFHTITTDDGVATAVCLTPVKTINGAVPDINGNVNVADLFSTTTDNGDGTYTTINADGTPITWSGDTFASGADNNDGTATITFSDSSTLTFCLNPVKSVVQNEDGLGATVTLADGTLGQLTYPAAKIVESTDGSVTVTPTQTGYDLSVPEVVSETLVIDCPEDSNIGTLQVNDEPVVPFVKGLTKCGGPLDVNADTVLTSGDGGTVVPSQALPEGCVDLACAPALPACPVEGSIAYSDGITWQIQGGVYAPVAVSPQRNIVVMNDDAGGTTVVDDAFIGALTGDWTQIDCISETYTNSGCVRVSIRAEIRAMLQAAGTAGNLWSLRIGPNAASSTGFVQGNGSPDSLLDVTNGEPFGQQKDYVAHVAYAEVDPGETVTLTICADARVINSNYVSDPANSMSVVGFTGRFEVERTC